MTIYLNFKYYKSADNIIFEFQRFFSVKKSKNIFQLKTKQLKQKIKLIKKKKQKRFNQIDNKRLKINIKYNCVKFKCFNYF